MNRVIQINNYVNPISIKDMEFKINELYLKNEIIIPRKICRYCWEEDNEEYISPCLCKGGSKYIHTDCLNQWRQNNANNIEKKKFL